MERLSRIGIIGAGFSGTTLAASLARYNKKPLELILIEKSNLFAAGEAYRTPYAFHYLNVQAGRMSAFEEDSAHFVKWLQKNKDAHDILDQEIPIQKQFVPRILYHQYLKHLLHDLRNLPNVNLKLVTDEIIDIKEEEEKAQLILSNKESIEVDKAILALGNMPTAFFPFPVSQKMRVLSHAWDYEAPESINTQDSVLIVGTGLSMIDTVLTLHQQKHQGKIYAISRHGLLPLRHQESDEKYELPKNLPRSLREISKWLIHNCRSYMQIRGDWRVVMTAFREHVPTIWEKLSTEDRKRFLRHALSYWNIHRHRVRSDIADLLQQLQHQGQLHILKGRVISVDENAAQIRLRHHQEQTTLPINWLINCMGPSATMSNQPNALVQQLISRGLARVDTLDLGFDINHNGALKNRDGEISNFLYTIGPPCRGYAWECTAVPDIRKQIFVLTKHLIKTLSV